MFQLNSLILVPLLGQLAFASPVRNQPRPELSITVTSTKGTGSGCPKGVGITTSAPSDNKNTFTIYTDDFDLYYGPGMTPKDKSKDCNVVIKLSYPTGYKFGVVGATYSAESHLDREFSAGISSTYLIGSGAVDAPVTQSWRYNGTGVVDESVIRDLIIPESSRVLSKCGENKAELKINTRAALTSRSSKNSGTIDDGPGFGLRVQQVHLGWVAC